MARAPQGKQNEARDEDAVEAGKVLEAFTEFEGEKLLKGFKQRKSYNLP